MFPLPFLLKASAVILYSEAGGGVHRHTGTALEGGRRGPTTHTGE